MIRISFISEKPPAKGEKRANKMIDQYKKTKNWKKAFRGVTKVKTGDALGSEEVGVPRLSKRGRSRLRQILIWGTHIKDGAKTITDQTARERDQGRNEGKEALFRKKIRGE